MMASSLKFDSVMRAVLALDSCGTIDGWNQLRTERFKVLTSRSSVRMLCFRDVVCMTGSQMSGF